MNKRTILVTAAVGVSILTAAMGFIAYDSVRSQSTENVVRISDARREALQLVALCNNPEGLKIQIAESTSKFGFLIASDRAKARAALVDNVIPVIDSRELACTSAQRDLTEVKRHLKTQDVFVDDSAPRVDAMVAKLAKAKAAATDLLAGFDRNAGTDELVAKLAPLRTAMD
ncbi:MAG: hypothetical protein ABI467_23815 [Kofleriaceae bacterium]